VSISGRLQAFLRANACALAVLVTAVAASDVALAGRTLAAGLLVIGHLSLWAAISAQSLAPQGEQVARWMGARPLMAAPLFFGLVLVFGTIPAALTAVMVVSAVALLGLTDALQRADVRRVILAISPALPLSSPPTAALDADTRC
jgi:hypothetical protein